MPAENAHTQALDPARVAGFLRQHLGTQVANVESVGHGEWSKAFTFRHGAAEYVVRFSATDEDFLKDQRAMRYASGDLPIPKIVDVGQAFGGYFAISERAAGDFLDALGEAQLRAALPSLFATLDAARATDLAA